jgi:hypothetical protein
VALETTPYRGLDDDEAHAAIRQHYEAYFDREGEELTWPHGPAAHRMGAFRVLEVAPGERTQLWTYASVGAFVLREPGLELLLLIAERSTRAVELVTIAAAHHQARGLRAGERIALGEPWIDGAMCDALLVSARTPFGAALERAQAGGRAVQVLWLLPITPAERRFAAERGVEELEQLFDDSPPEYWRRDRASVV